MKHFLLTLFTLFSCSAFSQDTIKIMNGDPIAVKVIRIGLDKIEYRQSEYESGPVFEKSIYDITYISLNGSPYDLGKLPEQPSPSSQNQAQENRTYQANNGTNSGEGGKAGSGSILKERRHYAAIGAAAGISGPDHLYLGLRAEGTYFFTPVFGIGLRVGFGKMGLKHDHYQRLPSGEPELSDQYVTLNSDNCAMNEYAIAPTLSIPMKRFSLNFKALVGAFSLNVTESNKSYFGFSEQTIIILESINREEIIIETSGTSSFGLMYGGGANILFNFKEKSPITFLAGVDVVRYTTDLDFDVTIRDVNGIEASYTEGFEVRRTSLMPHLMLVYQF